MFIRRLFCLLLTFSLLVMTIACSRAGKNGISPGDPLHFEVNDVRFTMRYVPAAVFPTGVDDDGEAEVKDPFWLGETEVTYELWYEIRIWALKNGYRFAQYGAEGGRLGRIGEEPTKSRHHPVTRINWFDAIAWCNALSEFLELTPVYLYDGEIFRDPMYLRDYDQVELAGGTGFRLPTADERQLAARYRGSDRSHGAIEYPRGSGMYWTPGNYASGAKGPITDEKATMEAAWYNLNSEIEDGGLTSHPVDQKPAGGNSLKLYGMSGNVFEWMHDVENYTHRGGCYYRGPELLQVGLVPELAPSGLSNSYPNLGLRLLLPVDDSDTTDSRQTTAQTTTMPATTTSRDETQTEPDESEPDMLFAVGSLVEVEWNGTWYLARIMEAGADRYFITYIGYDESWNEWAESDRVRELTEPLAIENIAELMVAVDLGTSLTEIMLPDRIEIILSGDIGFESDVSWDATGYNSEVPGEYELAGQLNNLPENIVNPDNLRPILLLRVRDEDGSQSRLRIGGRTEVDDLMFYIEHDEQIAGYYFGSSPDLDITHLVIEQNGSFAAMIVYDENKLPIQWVFPDLTISIVVPRNEFFDPGDAAHMFILDDEQIDMTLDISMDYSVDQVLTGMPQLLGSEFVEFAIPLRRALSELGWTDKTVEETIIAAITPYELAMAAMLSTLGTGMRLLDSLAVPEEDADLVAGSSGHFTAASDSGDGPLNLQQISTARSIIEKVAKKATPSVGGTCFSILKYLYKIQMGHYDGQNIKGPAVSMLLCAGASTVPSVCNEFYIPNTPGNVSKCVKICVVTMACFTEICHPMNFSAQDALGLRQPLKGP